MRYCQTHEGLARKYVQQENTMEDSGKKATSTDDHLLIVKILTNKLYQPYRTLCCNFVTTQVACKHGTGNMPRNHLRLRLTFVL